MDKNHNNDKYDRQIRLWGVHGQKKLMYSKICLLSCGPAGTETLKNLILPGVGEVTVVDDQTVSDRDLGNNFFVTEDDLGKSRAEAVNKWLCELNPDVQGKAVNENPSKLAETNPEFFKDFTLVISNDLSESSVINVGKVCTKYNVSLVVLRASGFIGSVRVYNAVHTIIEGRSERDLDGYRIFSPFAALQEYVSSFDISKLDDFQHRHMPYFIILINHLNEWRKSHDGNIPLNFKEKMEFGDIVKKSSRNWHEEENFQEAVKFAHKAFANPKNIPANVEKIFESKFIENVNEYSDHFWILSSALKKFYKKNECLPVRSTIPDLTADTDNYLGLQKIYQQKAQEDRNELAGFIKETIGNGDLINDDAIKTFCDNLYNLDFIALRSIDDEVNNPIELEVFETDCYKWHLGLRASSLFLDQNNRQPTTSEDDVNAINKIMTELQKKIPGLVANEEENLQIAKEMARFGGSDLHTISSVLGGVASQESIKLITHQFKPINNTYVYNGITSEAEVYEF